MKLSILICFVCFTIGLTEKASAEVSEPIYFDVGGVKSRVKIYSYKGGETKNHVVFKYGDLVQRAIQQKHDYPERDVEICFAIYKIERDTWIGFSPGTPEYGKVNGKAFGGEKADKLIYLLVQAARKRVYVRFVYHNPEDENNKIASYLEQFRDEDTTMKYLTVHRANWPDGGNSGQQHNKFMLLNFYSGDKENAQGKKITIKSSVYVATANVDKHENYQPEHKLVQSGVLVNGINGLYKAYRNYFKIILQNTNSIWADTLEKGPILQTKFHEAVKSAHKNSLNYSDGVFSAYFYPIPIESRLASRLCNFWMPDYNPVAKLTDSLIRRPDQVKYVKINMYRLDYDDFGKQLYKKLKLVKESTNVKIAFKRDKMKEGGEPENSKVYFDSLDNDLKFKARTHAKNYLFAFSSGGPREYFTITGSTNAKVNAYCSKANNQLVIKETSSDHPVYSEFKKVFEDAYR